MPEGLRDGYVIINVLCKVNPTDKLHTLLCYTEKHKRTYYSPSAWIDKGKLSEQGNLHEFITRLHSAAA